MCSRRPARPHLLSGNPEFGERIALVNWFRAEGIPIAPYDDAHRKNPYPLMRIIARNAARQPIATNDVVLPVSDEMDCRACHASGTIAGPLRLSATLGADTLVISWPRTAADALLEQTPALAPAALWSVAPDAVLVEAESLSVTRTHPVGNALFRIRRAW